MASDTKPLRTIIRPYVELMRVSNPVGSILVFFPQLIGTIFAACHHTAARSNAPQSLLVANLVLLPASSVLHAVGCSWNDIVDADLDRKVTRTKKRPIARGAIPLRNAYLFTMLQTIVWLSMLLLVSSRIVQWTPPLMFAIGLYPYAKRVTRYPSLFLGTTLAYGFPLGCIAMGLDPLDLLQQGHSAILTAMVCFYAAYTFLVTSVDMIYAHQDLPDDLKVGIQSMAVTFRGYPKFALAILALLQFALLNYAGRVLGFSKTYTVVTCWGVLITNSWMIWSVNLGDCQQCWWWFQYGSIMMGVVLSLGLFAEYTVNN